MPEEYVEVHFTLEEPQRFDELGANRRSSRLTQDAFFSPPVRLRGVVLQNHYSAALTIHVAGRFESVPTWHVALGATRLMEDAHYEDDAQDWHTFDLTSPQVAPPGALDCVHAARLTYLQPSPSWADFGARHIQCFTRESKPPERELSADAQLASATRGLALEAVRPSWRGEHGPLLAQMAEVLSSARRAAGLVEQLAAESGSASAHASPPPSLPPGEWCGSPVRALALSSDAPVDAIVPLPQPGDAR